MFLPHRASGTERGAVPPGASVKNKTDSGDRTVPRLYNAEQAQSYPPPSGQGDRLTRRCLESGDSMRRGSPILVLSPKPMCQPVLGSHASTFSMDLPIRDISRKR